MPTTSDDRMRIAQRIWARSEDGIIVVLGLNGDFIQAVSDPVTEPLTEERLQATELFAVTGDVLLDGSPYEELNGARGE